MATGGFTVRHGVGTNSHHAPALRQNPGWLLVLALPCFSRLPEFCFHAHCGLQILAHSHGIRSQQAFHAYSNTIWIGHDAHSSSSSSSLINRGSETLDVITIARY